MKCYAVSRFHPSVGPLTPYSNRVWFWLRSQVAAPPHWTQCVSSDKYNYEHRGSVSLLGRDAVRPDGLSKLQHDYIASHPGTKYFLLKLLMHTPPWQPEELGPVFNIDETKFFEANCKLYDLTGRKTWKKEITWYILTWREGSFKMDLQEAGCEDLDSFILFKERFSHKGHMWICKSSFGFHKRQKFLILLSYYN